MTDKRKGVFATSFGVGSGPFERIHINQRVGPTGTLNSVNWFLARVNPDWSRAGAISTRMKVSYKDALSLVIQRKTAVCEICEAKNVGIDHNRQNGQVMGFLCNRCNSLVGYLESSSPGILQKAKTYLRRYR